MHFGIATEPHFPCPVPPACHHPLGTQPWGTSLLRFMGAQDMLLPGTPCLKPSQCSRTPLSASPQGLSGSQTEGCAPKGPGMMGGRPGGPISRGPNSRRWYLPRQPMPSLPETEVNVGALCSVLSPASPNMTSPNWKRHRTKDFSMFRHASPFSCDASEGLESTVPKLEAKSESGLLGAHHVQK